MKALAKTHAIHLTSRRTMTGQMRREMHLTQTIQRLDRRVSSRYWICSDLPQCAKLPMNYSYARWT